jgi:hypothetical protein
MDRRNFDRIIFSSQARLTCGNQSWYTELLDLSLKGALLSTPEDFNLDSSAPMQLSFTLEGLEHPISMQGTIRHGDHHQLGFKTTKLDIDSATELRRLIELNISDETLLNRNLEALSKHG